MDELVKVYQPKSQNKIHYESIEESWTDAMSDYKKKTKKHSTKKVPVNKTSKHIKEDNAWQSRLDTLLEVLEARRRKELKLSGKHGAFNIIYNWVIIICVAILFVSFIWWGAVVIKERKENAIYATAYAEFQAEQEASAAAEEAARQEALAAEQASEDYIVKQISTALAKAFYGIRNFEEKYHHDENDFRTYARCWFNRTENPSYSNDFVTNISKEGQALAYDDSNPVIDRYYNMAEKFVKEWRSETKKPITNDFVFAELTNRGIYLTNEFNADGYARRWRADN